MIIIWGLRVFFRTIGQGTFFCRKCGGDREYKHRSGRRFFTVFFIPLIPLNKTGEHVRCETCKTRYVTSVLKQPTAEQMETALARGMRAAVVVMLTAGAPAGGPARQRAIMAVREAGARGYDDAALTQDLEQPAGSLDDALATLAGQLAPEAKERYVAELIRIGAADAPLTSAERSAAGSVAASLGMTEAQAIGVITLTEQKLV